MIKTGKEYLEFLPLSKWTDQTVRGKVLQDIINTVILLFFRKELRGSGYSTTEIFGKTQSLMYCLGKDGIVTVETPGKPVKNYYKLFGMEVPAHVKIGDCIKSIMDA